MYPFLKKNIVLVKGYSAYGVYDLNNGEFHRINLEAGEILSNLNGMEKLESFDESTKEFIIDSSKFELIEFSDKKKYQAQTQLESVLKKVRPVKFAWIELTSKCNQKCAHCFLGEDLNKFKHVPKDKIFEYLKILSDIGTKQIIFSGGEPTLHPEFKEIIDQAGAYKFRINVLTNASTKNFESLFQTFYKNNVILKIPILGWEQSHDQMTMIESSFETTIKNIKKLNNSNIKVTLGTTVTGINHQDIPKIREFANSLQLPLEVSPVYAVGFAQINSSKIFSLDQKKIIEICKKDKAMVSTNYKIYPAHPREQYEYDSTDYDSVNLKNYLTEHHECGQKIIAVLANGEVTPCLMLRNPQYSLGNTNDNSLLDILERKSKQSTRFDQLMSLKGVAGCSGCEARFACKAGGCPASSLANAGSIQLKNPMYKSCYYNNF
jgi:radical SAM protein with 4Fe4S-binding SPASM domain